MPQVKESKEVLLALMEVLKCLGPIFKDGFQAGQDLNLIVQNLVMNQDLKDKIELAVKGADQIPAEMKDIDLSEGLELLIAIAPELPKVINAWKK